MSAPAPSNEEELFSRASELPAAERAAFLDRACAGDAALRARVESLLRANEAAHSFMESPPAAELAQAVTQGTPRVVDLSAIGSATADAVVGDRIGRYKLLQNLGEGGCGVVFMAEQQEPVRRRVALKVIKLGMDTKEVVARFEAERQALALMDHPNIARVLDAGATDTGRPFFVMELVRGIPITKYCDEQNLPTTARLELFTAVCHAVQHAHQKGIIHRDLKPSNILVTPHDGRPVPKVIDFGIAKATAGRLTDNTLFTAFEQFIGTPAYMSPEQAELSGVTAASVVSFSLVADLLAQLEGDERRRTDAVSFAACGAAGCVSIRRTTSAPSAKSLIRFGTKNRVKGVRSCMPCFTAARAACPSRPPSWRRSMFPSLLGRCVVCGRRAGASLGTHAFLG